MSATFVRKIFSVTLAALLVCSMNFCAAAKKIVAVMPLENVSGFTEQPVADIITEQLIVALHSSGVYTVVERPQMSTIIREQGFQNIAVDPSQAVELGKLSGADYSMLGKVTLAYVGANPTATTIAQVSQIFQLGDIGAMADPFIHKFRGKIMLEFRFVDNTTGEIVLAKTVEASKSGATPIDAFNGACKKVAENFLLEIDSVNPFRARIAEISNSDIYIDRGSESGLQRGETLLVVREISPIVVNGRTVGMKQDTVGKIKVVEVFSDYAICRPAGDGGSGNIHKGDVVKRQHEVKSDLDW